MNNIETIEEFYKTKANWTPENLNSDIGHFNVFKLEPYIGCNAKPIPYRRRDFYKISLVSGDFNILYADKIIKVEKQALIFSNPQIPYKWDNVDRNLEGYFCVFTSAFFYQFATLNQYSIFQPNGNPVFELSDEQAIVIKSFYERMFEEIQSDYQYKYDVLRTIVLEIIHFAMKLQPLQVVENHKFDASQRITNLFLELLERQFPIDDTHQKINLRSASDYANQLNVHVNHLNRAIKESTTKTTSQIIAERILLEAKILLKHTNWNVSEIAYALGFTEVTHFNNFFKKHIAINPTKFRIV